MNYYTAREIAKDGKPTGMYHYTVQNSSGIHPVGYCSSYRTCPACEGRALAGQACDQCDRGAIRVEPCPGHPTPEEAAEHYRQYELDGASYEGVDRDAQHKCAICSSWTQRYATMGNMRRFYLCDEHCNRGALEKLTGPMDDIISSF